MLICGVCLLVFSHMLNMCKKCIKTDKDLQEDVLVDTCG